MVKDPRDLLPPPPWEGPPVPKFLRQGCPVCSETAQYLFMGTEAEAAHLALQLGITVEEVYSMVTCPRCEVIYIGSRVIKRPEHIVPYPGKSLLDVIREILHGEH